MNRKSFVSLMCATIMGIGLCSCGQSAKTYVLTLQNDEPERGSVHGEGEYKAGEDVTVTAEPNEGYKFDAWYQGDSMISPNLIYTFPMPEQDVTYKAKFKPAIYSVSVDIEDSDKGTVSGGGQYYFASSVTITFSPKEEDGTFLGWFEGETLLTEEKTYSFDMPDRDVSYVARFAEEEGIVKLGSYPQKEVKDYNLKKNLTAMAGELPSSKDPKNWNPMGRYSNGNNNTEIAWYIDLDVNGDGKVEYRGLYFSDYLPFNTVLGSGANNSYQDENGYYPKNVYWFAYEPIKWKVLSEGEDSDYLFSIKVLDCQTFSVYNDNGLHQCTDLDGHVASVYPNNYRFSTIRTYLNTTFFDEAFSATDKERVLETTLDNSVASTGYETNVYACEDTNDFVYLPSFRDVLNTDYGFSDNQLSKDESKQLLVTDYALAVGCFKPTGPEFTEYSEWWTRSPEKFNSLAVHTIFSNGIANGYHYDYAYSGVAPAISIAK